MKQREKVIEGCILNLQTFKTVLAFLTAEFTSEAISSKKSLVSLYYLEKNSIIGLKIRLKRPC